MSSAMTITMSFAHSPTLPSLHLRHSSFSNPSVALPTSQFILQHFRCFTYVTAHSATLLSLLLRHRLFTWRAAHEKRNLKHYEGGVSRHLFLVYLAPRLLPSQGLHEFITEDQSNESFHVPMTFLIVLPTPSLHIEMVSYCTSYTNNRTC